MGNAGQLMPQPRYRLEVRFPAGRRVSFPLASGSHRIGSGESCAVRIESDQVADCQAELEIGENEIFLTTFGDSRTVHLEDVPLREGKHSLYMYDVLKFGSLNLTLLPIDDKEEENRLAMTKGTEKLGDRLGQELAKGISGYAPFQRQLAPEIHPDEAERTQGEFRRRRLWLIRCVVVFVVAHALKYLCVPTEDFHMREIIDVALEFASILAALLLGSKYSLPWFAVLPFLGTLLQSWSPPIEYFDSSSLTEPEMWTHRVLVVVYFLVAPVLFALGFSARLGLKDSRLRRACLFFFGFVWLAGYAGAIRNFHYPQSLPWLPLSPSPPFLASLHAVPYLLCCIWPWLPSRWWFERGPPAGVDEQCVLEWAGHRFTRFTAGRVFAIALGLFPFWLFITALDIDEHIRWPDEADLKTKAVVMMVWSETNHVASETNRISSETNHLASTTNLVETNRLAWFWPLQRRWLQDKDFAPTNQIQFYAWRTNDFESPEAFVKSLEEISAQQPARKHTPADARAIDTLACLLSTNTEYGTRSNLTAEIFQALTNILDQSYRITNSTQFINAARTWYPKTNLPSLFTDGLMMEWQEVRPSYLAPNGTNIYGIQNALIYGSQNGPELLGLTKPETKLTTSYFLPAAVLLLGYGIMGSLFLWRRSGDHPAAFLIGVWLITGFASVLIVWFSGYFILHFNYILWLNNLHQPFGGFLEGVSSLVQALSDLFNSFFVEVLVVCSLWLHFCWPAKETDTQSAWRRWTRAFGKLFLVMMAWFVLQMFVVRNVVLTVRQLLSDVPSDDPLDPTNLCWGSLERFLSYMSLVLVGWVMRHHHQSKSEMSGSGSALQPLGFLAVFAFVAAAMGIYWIEATLAVARQALPQAQTFCWIAIGLTVSAFLATLFLIVRGKFLQVTITQGLHYVAMLVLPFGGLVIHYYGMHLPGMAKWLGASAAVIVGAFIVRFFHEPLFHRIESGANHLLVPKLKRTRKIFKDCLEEIDRPTSPEDKWAAIEHAFRRLEIPGFVFYKRQGADFKVHINRMPQDPSLPLSQFLCKFLGRRSAILDLKEEIVFEWDYFFHQFELRRLKAKTGCRFLLPIRLDENVRGLLLLPDGRAAEDCCKEPMRKELESLGDAVLHIPVGPGGAHVR